MAVVLRELIQKYNYLIGEFSDHRVSEWFLMGSPWPTVIVGFIYLKVVLNWGPKWMQTRKPFNIDKLLVWYNATQILACLYIVVQGVSLLVKYSAPCQPVDYSSSEDGLKAVHVAWTYYMIKVIDLLDTVFFIMRKKESQISFLHVYHHWGMVLLSWTWVKFLGGGATLYIIVLNSFIHVLMYSYYLLSAYDKKYSQNLWWKKYITQMQLFQFIILSIQHIAMLYNGCNYPNILLILYLIQSINMIFLFGDFYIKAYFKRRAQKVKSANGKNILNGHQLEQKVLCR